MENRTYIPNAEMMARTDIALQTPNGLMVKLENGECFYYQPYAQGWQPARDLPAHRWQKFSK